MEVTVESILVRLKELNIQPVVQDGNLILRARPGTITERCKQVVRENREAIIAHLSRPVPFEERIADIFPGGCEITMQPVGTTLADHLAANQQEKKEAHRSQKSPWTKDQWKQAEEKQFEKVREYQQRIGK